MDYLRGILGLVFLIGFLYLLSNNRRAIDWKLVGVALLMQFLLGLAILKIPSVRYVFDKIKQFCYGVLQKCLKVKNNIARSGYATFCNYSGYG